MMSMTSGGIRPRRRCVCVASWGGVSLGPAIALDRVLRNRYNEKRKDTVPKAMRDGNQCSAQDDTQISGYLKVVCES